MSVDPRIVRVCGVPGQFSDNDRIRDKLLIHFLRPRNNGGEILHLDYPTAEAGVAMMMFEHAEVAEQVLRRTHWLEVDGQSFPLEVMRPQFSMPIRTTLDLLYFSDPEQVVKLLEKYRLKELSRTDTEISIFGEFQNLTRFRREILGKDHHFSTFVRGQHTKKTFTMEQAPEESSHPETSVSRVDHRWQDSGSHEDLVKSEGGTTLKSVSLPFFSSSLSGSSTERNPKFTANSSSKSFLHDEDSRSLSVLGHNKHLAGSLSLRSDQSSPSRSNWDSPSSSHENPLPRSKRELRDKNSLSISDRNSPLGLDLSSSSRSDQNLPTGLEQNLPSESDQNLLSELGQSLSSRSDHNLPSGSDQKLISGLDQMSLSTSYWSSPSGLDHNSLSRSDRNSPSGLDQSSSLRSDRNSPSGLDQSSSLRSDRNSPLGLDQSSSLRSDRNSPLRLDQSSSLRSDRNSPLRLDQSSSLRSDRNSPLLLDQSLPSKSHQNAPSGKDWNSPSWSDQKPKSISDRNSPSVAYKTLSAETDLKFALRLDQSSPSRYDQNSLSRSNKNLPSGSDKKLQTESDLNILSAPDKNLQKELNRNLTSVSVQNSLSRSDQNFLSGLELMSQSRSDQNTASRSYWNSSLSSDSITSSLSTSDSTSVTNSRLTSKSTSVSVSKLTRDIPSFLDNKPPTDRVSDMSPGEAGGSSSVETGITSLTMTKLENVSTAHRLSELIPVDNDILCYIHCFKEQYIKEILSKCLVEMKIENCGDFSYVTLSGGKSSGPFEEAFNAISQLFTNGQTHLRTEDIDLTKFPPNSRSEVTESVKCYGLKHGILTTARKDLLHLIGPSHEIHMFKQEWKANPYQRYVVDGREINNDKDAALISPRPPAVGRTIALDKQGDESVPNPTTQHCGRSEGTAGIDVRNGSTLSTSYGNRKQGTVADSSGNKKATGNSKDNKPKPSR